jgi:DNA-binding NarL/FixJ family response regulator
MDSKITIVLADDHVLVRKGIRAMLESDDSLEVIGEADNGEQAIRVVKELKPDLLITDIRMPILNGLEAVEKLCLDPAVQTRSIILSMHDSEEYVLQALKAGAMGYLLKDTDKSEFIKALYQVHTGIKYFSGSVSEILTKQLLSSTYHSKVELNDPYHLTKKEKELLRFIIEGRQNKQIADLLGKSVRTVETHRFNIMKKLDVNNAIDMVNKVIKENLV